MSIHRKAVVCLASAVALATATLNGCQTLGAMVGLTPGPSQTATPISSATGQPIPGANGLVSNNTANLSGVVTGPGWLVSNNAGGLVSNNAGGYRTQALTLGPAQRAVVYLTTPNEQFYAGPDGKALFTVTDDQGRYAFPMAPAGVPVIVTVLLPNNRRLVGYLNPSKGANTFNVDLASTVVTEYLRDQARLGHKNMGDYPALNTLLPKIVSLTQGLVSNGTLRVKQGVTDTTGVIDFNVNAIPAMRHEYVRAFAASNKDLSDAWQQLLGYRPLLIEDLDVGLPAGYTTLAVGVGSGASSGSIFAAGINTYNLGLYALTPTATRALIVTPRSKGISYIGGIAASDSLVFFGTSSGGQYEIDMRKPDATLLRDTASDSLAAGSNFVQWNQGWDNPASPSVFDGTGNASAYDVDVAGGYVYAASDQTNEIYRYRLDAGGNAMAIERLSGVPMANQNPTLFFTGDVLAPSNQVRLNFPAAVTYHVDNGTPYVYFADCDNQRIRRTNLAATPSYTTETVLGIGTNMYGNEIKPPDAAADGKIPMPGSPFTDLDDPQGVPVGQASFAFPHKVVFDASNRMFIADSDHRRVRMYDPSTKRVYTIAGTDDPVAQAVTGDSRRCGLGEVTSIAFDASGSLIIGDARSNVLHRIRLPFGL